MTTPPDPRRGPAGRLLRRLIQWPRGRKWLIGAASSVMVAVDETATAYQPVDVLGIAVDGVTRARIESRWEAIEPVVERVGARSALDVGAAEGFYALHMARMGMQVVALEAKERPSRILRRAVAIIDPPGQLAQLRMKVSPENVALLPEADAVLLLAVWHHWVRDYGRVEADRMLKSSWERASRVLFFETGENMPSHYGLPDLGRNPRSALEDWLLSTCPGSSVEFLGRHPDRHLFAVVRD